MTRYIVHRLLQGVVLLCMVATIVFFLGRLTGNPVDLMLPEDATAEDRVAMIKALGLDGPLYQQFFIFAGNALHGDLGNSIRMREPAVDAFFSRLPNTLALIPWAILLAMGVGIPLGVLASLNRGNIIDRAAGTIAVLGIAIPGFWLGILLIFIFSVELGWLPSGRMGGPEHYVLPVITLGAFLIAGFMRLVRSSMLEVMDSEYVKLARIKGLSERVVIWKHCLRNALIPVLTLWGVFIGNLITGAIITETVFAWPGIGRLTYEAVIFHHPQIDFDPEHQSGRGHLVCVCRPAHSACVEDQIMRRVPWIPICIISTMIFMAVFAPLLAPWSPIDQTLPDKLLPPFWVEGGSMKYILGTDAFGRDILSRLIYGARVSLIVAVLALTAGGGTGLTIGIVAGYFGGTVDNLLMRLVDAAFTFPAILFALLLAVTMGQGLPTLITAISLLLWASFARVIRGEVLALKQRDFVALARVRGCSSIRIMLTHILPNVLNTFMVLVTLNIGVVIIAEASLSFLGAGIPPPTPTWGLMISEGRGRIADAWWVSIIPGIAITLLVLSVNLFGDWLRDRMDPRLRQL
jgi:ABC-type dipeptide/oligopeptide/nickel transport system permease subunit